MATNVFGNPVTKLTLEAMVEYDGKEITRFDLARVAHHLKHAEHKAMNARAYVDNLKTNSGSGVSTKCLIYNATGEPITFVRSYDWHGSIGESPYPLEIANGEWGAFLHTKSTTAAAGSEGAVVYRIKGLYESSDMDCMAAWCSAWGGWYNNHCYAEIRDQDHFDNTVWDVVERKMCDTGLQCIETQSYLQAAVTMGNETTSEWEATLKIDYPY